jgi:hypothetical protein
MSAITENTKPNKDQALKTRTVRAARKNSPRTALRFYDLRRTRGSRKGRVGTLLGHFFVGRAVRVRVQGQLLEGSPKRAVEENDIKNPPPLVWCEENSDL